MSSIVAFEKVFMSIPFEEKDWAKDEGLKFDGKGKCWYLPPGKDPLPFRSYWSYLENTFNDREELKKRGCRYNSNLKKWYVPGELDYNKFTKWWPVSLKQFLFNDRYAIHHHHAKTGQADVFKAYDIIENTPFAIKYFLNDIPNFSTTTLKKSFGLEMNALLQLEGHNNILNITDWGENTETDRRFIISPWIKGGSIDKLIGQTPDERIDQMVEMLSDLGLDFDDDDIKEMKEEFDDTDWGDQHQLISGVLEGIFVCHSKGIYHRDIKPGNILFDIVFKNESEIILLPILCDFGTSKFFEEDENLAFERDKHTLVSLRTAPYRPEFNTDSKLGSKELSSQNTWDLFAWAVLSIELLANEHIDTVDEARTILNEKVIPKVGPEVAALFKSALAKNPDDRPQGIAKFRHEFVELTKEI
jgi:serine/threonine protein kinase